jgi:hypothetical protein
MTPTPDAGAKYSAVAGPPCSDPLPAADVCATTEEDGGSQAKMLKTAPAPPAPDGAML